MAKHSFTFDLKKGQDIFAIRDPCDNVAYFKCFDKQEFYENGIFVRETTDTVCLTDR